LRKKKAILKIFNKKEELTMQIWLDTINLEVVEDAAKTGILSGITTNPSILSTAKNVPNILKALLELQEGPIAIQVTAEDAENMIIEGREIFAFSNRAIIKIPVNHDGLIAIQQLHKENIPVLGTGVFHTTQALLAANQGAKYISPYFSHIGDIGDAYESLNSMATILQKYPTKLLVASLRNLDDLVYCALLGIDAVTIKDELYYKLVAEHPLLERFSHKFLSDWREAHGNVSIKTLLTKQTEPKEKFATLLKN